MNNDCVLVPATRGAVFGTVGKGLVTRVDIEKQWRFYVAGNPRVPQIPRLGSFIFFIETFQFKILISIEIIGISDVISEEKFKGTPPEKCLTIAIGHDVHS